MWCTLGVSNKNCNQVKTIRETCVKMKRILYRTGNPTHSLVCGSLEGTAQLGLDHLADFSKIFKKINNLVCMAVSTSFGLVLKGADNFVENPRFPLLLCQGQLVQLWVASSKYHVLLGLKGVLTTL